MSRDIDYVETLHLNIGIGDCAVVCKLRVNPTTRLGKKPLLIGCVLIDGGYNAYTSIIEYCLDTQIPSLYEIPVLDDGSRRVLLDSVVITHYDRDHYEGVLNLIRRSIKPIKTGDKKVLLSRYFRYSAAAEPIPETCLYLPYWDVNGEKKKARRGKLTRSGTAPNCLLTFESSDLVAEFVCRVRAGWEEVRGCDLLMGNPPLTANQASPAVLGASLAAINQIPVTPQSPTLVIVGADRRSFGEFFTNPVTRVAKEVSHSSRRSSDPKLKEPTRSRPGVIRIINDESVAEGADVGQNTNASSIICLVMWTDGRVSHYMAGDSYWRQELAVINWIMQDRATTYNIGAVKLSHHGASTSSPPDLFTKLNPTSVIVSAGSEHGHPRWELLIWLHVWAIVTERGRHFFWPTNYPYWLSATVDYPLEPVSVYKHIGLPQFVLLDKGLKSTSITAAIRNPQARTPGKKKKKKGKKNDEPLPTEAKRTAVQQFQAIVDQALGVDSNGQPLSGAPEAILRHPITASGGIFMTQTVFDSDIQNAKSAASPLPQISGRRERIYHLIKNKLWRDLSVIDESATPLTDGNISKGSISFLRVVSPFPGATTAASGGPAPEGTVIPWTVGADFDAIPRAAADSTAHRFKADRTTEIKPTRSNTDNSMLIDGDPEIGKRKSAKSKEAAARLVQTLDDSSSSSTLAVSADPDPFDSTDEDYSEEEEEREALEAGSPTTEDTTFKHAVAQTSPPAPRPNVGAAPALPGPSGTPGRHFITSSSADVSAFQAQSGDVLHIITGTSRASQSLSNFVGSLFTACCEFAALPGATDQPFLDEDDMSSWFAAGLHADGLFAKGTADMLISEISLVITTPFALTTPATWQIRFSTSPDAFQATFQGMLPQTTDVLPVFPFGNQEKSNTLILALDGTPQVTTTLAEVLSYINMDGSLLLRGLTSLLSLTLDTSPGSRNAVWFNGYGRYQTTMRLQFNLTDIDKFETFLHTNISSKLALNKDKSHITVRKVVTQCASAGGYTWFDDPELIIMVTFQRDVTDSHGLPAKSNLEAVFSFTHNALEITIEPDDGTLGDLLGWLATLIPGETGNKAADVENWVKKVSTSAISVRKLNFTVNDDGMQHFGLDLELDVEFGKSDQDPSAKVAFLLSYSYSKPTGTHQVRGTLMDSFYSSALDVNPQELTRDYEDYQKITKPKAAYSDHLHASNLLPGTFKLLSVPKELDLLIYSLDISLSSTDFSLEGTMICDSTKVDSATHFVLERVQIQGSYTFSPEAYDVTLESRVRFVGHDTTPDAFIDVSVAYDSTTKAWDLQGSIESLSMANLVSLFPGTDGSTVMDIAQHFEIEFLSIDYKYVSGAGSKFDVSATLLLGVFNLDLSFTWEAGKDWDFVAALSLAPDVDTDLVSLLKATLPDSSIVDIIPGFANFSIGSKDMKSTGSSLSLHLKKSTSGTTTFIVFVLSLLVKGSGNEPDLRMNLVQIKETVAGSAKSTTKRLLKVSVESIPWDALPNVPMVGGIKKPFKELEYAWVHDADGKGLTRAEVNGLQLVPEVGQVRYKDLVPVADRSNAEHLQDILLTTGSHFIVVADEKSEESGEVVIIDYTFQSTKDKEEAKQSQVAATPEAEAFIDDPKPTFDGFAAGTTTKTATPASANEPEGEAAMGKLSTSQGPLSFSNIGFKYSGGKLQVLFDATVKLGPLEFELLGFGISLDFSGGINLRTLSKLAFGHGLDLNLKGLGCEYNNSPLVIAGLFEDLSVPPNLIKYVGGVSVGFEPYNFMAVGGYEEITQPDKHTYKSIFIFAKLNGPLIEFEFAEISGICGGFGYNSDLRFPTLAGLDQFPFVSKPAGATSSGDGLSGTDPLAVLKALTDPTAGSKVGGWVTSREGSIWLAAGLDVKAFQVLSVNAIIVLEFNPFVTLGIFAKALARLPAAVDANPPPAFLYVEMGLAATVDFHGGTMRIEGSLSPNSFVLNPFCHLSGGFGLCYWFGSNPHAGDFVFTVGGYHAAFQVPDHYPKADRLQIYWDVGGGLKILGQAYLAVTPKVCMAGGLLAAVLDLGPLGAHFNAHADLLITYKPFHFHGDAGVEIGVTFTLDLLLVTIHISVDISAELTLYGPPFGGDVYVDFWVFGFSIAFGDSEFQQPILTLPQFYNLLMQEDQAALAAAGNAPKALTGSTTLATPTKAPNDHVLAVERGRFVRNKSAGSPDANNTETPEGAVWLVKPQGFIFRVQSRFAIGTAILSDTKPTDDEVVATAIHPIYAKPMHLVAGKGDDDQQISSTMTITISADHYNVGEFTCVPVYKKVPQALWAPYEQRQDPIHAGNNASSVLSSDNLTVDHIMGIQCIAPPPYLSKDPIKAFDAKDANSADVIDSGPDPTLSAVPVNTNAAWDPQNHPVDVDSNSKTLWDIAQQAWKAQSDLVAETGQSQAYGLNDVVGMWADVMKWDSVIDAAFPQEYVDNLAEYHLSAPFIGT